MLSRPLKVGQGCCDDTTKALLLECVTVKVGGVKNCPKLRDVIYGQPLSRYFFESIKKMISKCLLLSCRSEDKRRSRMGSFSLNECFERANT